MKKLLFLLCICFFNINLIAQNYYVLQIKGEVFIQKRNKIVLLKKRDIIREGDKILFEDRKSAVRLIGKNGHFYIKVNDNADELAVVLNEETFSKPIYTFSNPEISTGTSAKTDLGDIPTPSYYNTLLKPYSILEANEKEMYYIQYEWQDSLHQKVLKNKDGAIALSPGSFPETGDEKQIYTIISKKESSLEITEQMKLRIDELNWIPRKDVAAYVKTLIKKDSTIYNQEALLHTYLKHLYSQDKYIPIVAMKDLIDTEIPWYEFPPQDIKTMYVSPTFLTLDEFSFEEEGSYRLINFAVVGEDFRPMESIPIGKEGKYYTIYMKNLGIDRNWSKWSQSNGYMSNLHAIVFQPKSSKDMKDAIPLYYLHPKKLELFDQLLNEAGYIYSRCKINEKEVILDIVKDMLDQEYGANNYIRESIDYILD